MFDRASKIEKVFRRYPRAPVFARLAEQLLRRGRLQRAQSLCEQGCERFPSYPTGFIVLSRCYARQKLWEEARSALDKALRLDPDNPAGYQRLARVYRELDNDTLALKCLERAAALDPLSQSLRDELELMSRSLRRPSQPEPAPAPREEPAEEPPADETLADETPADETPAGLENETVAEVEAEPFAQVAPRPEWDTPLDQPAASTLDASPQEVPVEAEPDVAPAAEVEAPPADAEVSDCPVPDSEVPDSEVSEVSGGEVPEDDVVAALGAGLFDDEESPPLQAQSPTREQQRRAPSAATDPVPVEDVRPEVEPEVPAPEVRQPNVPEAQPLPIELLDSPAGATRAPAETAASQPTGAAQLTRRRGTELTDLLREFGDSTQHPAEPEDQHEEDAAVATVTLAELYVEQGYDEQALAVYRRVLQIDPDNETARRGAAALGPIEADSTTGAT